MIIQALNARQKARGGYLTEDDLRRVARELSVSLHQIEALVTFFPHYRTQPPPKVDVHICRDMSCHLRGSLHLIDRLSRWAQDCHVNEVHISGVSCLGRCDRAPAALVNEKLYVLRDEPQFRKIIESHLDQDLQEPPNTDWELAQSKVGKWEIDTYEGPSSYESVREFVAAPDPELVIKALETAGLLGMGGAGGRTYMKWNDVRQATGLTKYVVCNADESEPGTFKDRELLLAAPHLTIEGMILAALVVGASKGWVYLRHEYPEQADAVDRELDRARRLGALGNNIFGSQYSFSIEVFVSPGNYICGEQTALIEAMEDKRAEPRNRPPELMTNGYKNQPTLLNNVETFAWVPAILQRSSGQWYAQRGKKSGPWVADASDSIRGMRFFSISGDVFRPGVYEVPTGIPLGELIDNYCGGMANGKEIVAVALSGPSGGLLPPKIPINALNRRFVEKHVPAGITELDVRDIPLDINVSRALDIMIGAGIVIYGTGADVASEAITCSRFFRNESCGKCVPCRIGSQKITEMGERLAEGSVSAAQLNVLRDAANELSQVMKSASICGLGQVASNPIRSLLTFFPNEVAKLCSQAGPVNTQLSPKENQHD